MTLFHSVTSVYPTAIVHPVPRVANLIVADEGMELEYLGICDLTESGMDREFKERYQTWKTHSQSRWVVFVLLMGKDIMGPDLDVTKIVLATLAVIDRSAPICGSRGQSDMYGGGVHETWHGLKAVVEEMVPREAPKAWSIMGKSRTQAAQIQWLAQADKIPHKSNDSIAKRRSIHYDYPGDMNDLDACTADQRRRVIDRAAGLTADEAEKIWSHGWNS